MDELNVAQLEQYIAKLAEAKEANQDFVRNLLAGNRQAAEDVARNLGVSIKDIEKNSNVVKDAVKKHFGEIGVAAGVAADDINKKLAEALNNFDITAEKISEKAKGVLQTAGKLVLNFAAEFDEKKAQTSLRRDISGILGDSATFLTENAVDLSKAFLFRKGVDIAYNNLVPLSVRESERYYQEWAQNTARAINNVSGALAPTGTTAADFGYEMQEAARHGAEAMEKLGISASTSGRELGKLIGIGLSETEIDRIRFDDKGAASAERSVSGLTATLALAAGTGQDTARVNEIVYQSLRKLGRTGEEVDNIFAAFKLTQEGTGLSYTKVQDSLQAGASALAFYGTKAEDLTGIFKSLTKSLGVSRAELALPMFKNLISGIEGMSDGMKGFISLSTGLAGPGGALSGILKMEDALAEGRFDEVVDRIQSSIERLSGGTMLTREQAAEQGQEQRFFFQRKLLAQMTGIQNAGQLRELQNMLGGGDRMRAADVLGQRQDSGAVMSTALERGRRTIIQEEGPLRSQLNRITAQSVRAMGRFTGHLIQSSSQVSESTQNLIRSFSQLAVATAVEGGGAEANELIDAVKEGRDFKATSTVAAFESPQNRAKMGLIPALRMPLAGLGLTTPEQLNSPEMQSKMNLVPGRRLNAVDTTSAMGMTPGNVFMPTQGGAERPVGISGELGSGLFDLDVGMTADVARELAAQREAEVARATGEGPVGAQGGIAAAAANAQTVRFQVADEPLPLKLTLSIDNQGRLVADLNDAMREVALQVQRETVNGD